VKSDYSYLFVALAFRNELQYRNSGCKKFICEAVTSKCVNFGPVTLEFKKVKDVHHIDFTRTALAMRGY